jgi:hypothetical protein
MLSLLAAPQPVPFQTPEVVTLFVWILLVIAVFALSGLVFFAVRTLKKVDVNQNIMFERLHSLETEFNTMKGEHQLMMKLKNGCKD